jgi:hypothetical protein
VNVGSALVGLLVSGGLLLAGVVWLEGGLPLSALALPLVWLPMVPLLLGLGWLLSGMGTYVRDVGQILGPVLSAMMFLTPIFFPVESLPESVRGWMALKPVGRAHHANAPCVAGGCLAGLGRVGAACCCVHGGGGVGCCLVCARTPGVCRCRLTTTPTWYRLQRSRTC